MKHEIHRVHEALRGELEDFLENLPPSMSNIMNQTFENSIRAATNVDGIQHTLERDQVQPGSGGQTDLYAKVLKTTVDDPGCGRTERIDLKVDRKDKSHIFEQTTVI